jgi:hypothetical protein
VVIPGTGRIMQLRITARRHRRLDANTSAAPPSRARSGELSAGRSRYRGCGVAWVVAGAPARLRAVRGPRPRRR